MEGQVCLFSTNSENCSNWPRVSARPCMSAVERGVADVFEFRRPRLERERGRGACLRRSAVVSHALALINTPIGWHSRRRRECVKFADIGRLAPALFL